ncbi:MAG: tetratricopeptide repeat protein [Thiotrichales bacterium]
MQFITTGVLNPGGLTRSIGILIAAGILLGGCAAAPPRSPAPVVQRPAPPAPPVRPAPPLEQPQVIPLGETRMGRPVRLPERMPAPQPLPESGVTTLPAIDQGVLAPSPGSVQPATADDAAVVAPQASAPRNPVVVSMLSAADQYQQSGDLERASSSVERGLRVAPRDAHLWQRLARIRLQQGRYQQAEEMAKKSSSLAQGDRGLVAQNWLVIAEARGRLGDTSGATDARNRAAQMQ